MRVAAIQMQCSADRIDNLVRAATLIGRAAEQGAELAVLPELFASLGRTAEMRAAAEPLNGPTVAWASALARGHHCWIVAGSFVERDGEQLFNTSVLLDPDGALIAHYRKVHLFDIDVAGATSRESDTFSAGDDAVVAQLSPAGEPDGSTPDGATPNTPKLGLTICYDLRFPELFRIEALRGAQLIAVPSAFTAATGADHWELLVRARAVENQVAIIAAAQSGTSPDGVERHGHALIVDAWGTVLAEAPGEGDAVVVADIDLGAIAQLRKRLPSLANRRPDAYRWPD
jgi:deaminated glutathione amidase